MYLPTTEMRLAVFVLERYYVAIGNNVVEILSVLLGTDSLWLSTDLCHSRPNCLATCNYLPGTDRYRCYQLRVTDGAGHRQRYRGVHS